jgi:hypothetical protein
MFGRQSQVPIVAQLSAAADRLESMRVLIAEGRRMALKDKADILAARMGKVPAALHARMDGIMTRFDALEAHGENTFSAIEAIVADAESSVQTAESAMAALSNQK